MNLPFPVFDLVNQDDGNLDYETTVMLAPDVTLDVRLTIPADGKPPYLSIDIGNSNERGDPIEYPITRDQATTLLFQSLTAQC